MGNAPLQVPVPDEQGLLPSDAFLAAISAARQAIVRRRRGSSNSVVIACVSEWSWLTAATLLADLTDDLTWSRSGAGGAAAAGDGSRGGGHAPALSASAPAVVAEKADEGDDDDQRCDVETFANRAAVGGGDALNGTVDVAIVLLGNLPLNAYTMTVDSRERVKKAASEYARARAAGKRAVVICCGGKSLYTFQGDKYGERAGDQRCLSEAEMMAAWLLATGGVGDRRDIVLEDQSMTTNENGAFASALIERLLKPNKPNSKEQQLHEQSNISDDGADTGSGDGGGGSGGGDESGDVGDGGDCGGCGGGDGGEVVLVSKAAHLAWAQQLYVQFPRLANARLAGAEVDRQQLMRQLLEFAEKFGDDFARARWGYLRDGITGLD
jgi:hypothetical protein